MSAATARSELRMSSESPPEVSLGTCLPLIIEREEGHPGFDDFFLLK
jgi:hypothetical protein